MLNIMQTVSRLLKQLQLAQDGLVAGVDGEALLHTMHDHGNRDSLVYWLEFKDDDEFLELGPDEYFGSAGLTFIEWADRVARCLPPDRLAIEIEVTGETSRRLTVTGTGAESRRIAEELSAIV